VEYRVQTISGRVISQSGSGSTFWLRSRHHTIGRTWADAAYPSVIGGSEFLPFTVADIAPLAAGHNVWAAATTRVSAPVESWRECPSTFGLAATAGNGQRRFCLGAAERVRRFPHRLGRVSYSIDETVNQRWRVH